MKKEAFPKKKTRAWHLPIILLLGMGLNGIYSPDGFSQQEPTSPRQRQTPGTETEADQLPLLPVALTLLIFGLGVFFFWQYRRQIESLTEQNRQAQVELQQAHRIRQRMVEGSPQAVHIFRAVRDGQHVIRDFELVAINPASSRMGGYTDSHLGKRFSELSMGHQSGRLFEQLVAVVEQDQTLATEVYEEAVDRFFELTAFKLEDGFYGTFTEISDRKKAERTLQETNQKYEAIFNQTSQIMSLLDLEGCFLDVNQTATQLTGWTRRQYQGTYLGDSPAWRYEQEGRRVKEAVKEAATGKPVHLEVSIYGPQRQLLHLDISITPIFNQQGQILFLLSEARDISERVRLDRKDQYQATIISGLLDNFPMVLYKIDRYGIIRESSGSGLRNLGYREGELVGTNAFAVYPHIEEQIRRVLQGESVSYERKLELPDRTVHFLNFFFPDTTSDCAVGIAVDITQQKEAEVQIQRKNEKLRQTLAELENTRQQLVQTNNELEERVRLRTAELEKATVEANLQRERLYSLFMQAPAMIVIARGPNYVFDLVNPLYQQLLGQTTPIIGKPLLEVIPDFSPAQLAIVEDVYKGNTFIGREYPMHVDWDQTGQPYTRYFTFVYEPLREADGTVDGVLSFGFEVTEHVKARQQVEETTRLLNLTNKHLQERNEELVRTNTDLDNFIYTASHDLKTPIVNLEGLLLALSEELSADSAAASADILRMMEGSIAKFKETISGLIEITKAQKTFSDTSETVSIAEVVTDLKKDLEDLVREANGVIEESYEIEQLHYPRSYLRSIMYNLLSNAVKYRSPDRDLRICVRTRVAGDFKVLTVEDNGLGLDQQEKAKLFTMFKRLHTHVYGTGVGLYIIKRMVENNRGRVEVESEKGVGTSFNVYLPMVKVSAPAVPPP